MDEPRDWVELRVHGVSGTPPQDMLRSAHVVQVAGDELSAFYRPADSLGRELPADGHVLEAYHWGKFTSGSWQQGLWLVLLPFGMVNAAQFMLPRPGPAPSAELFADPDAATAPRVRSATRWHAVAGGMLRLIGLGLTCTFLLSIAVVLVDLTAWQWVPTRPTLAWSAVPGWPLALALLGCVAVLLTLSAFGRDRGGRRPGAAPDQLRGAPDIPPTDLGRASFFRGDPDAPALRRLHIATGLAFLALLGFQIADVAWGAWISAGWLTILVLGTVFLGDPERGARGIAAGRWKSWRAIWHERVVPVLTPALVVVSAVLALVAIISCAAYEQSPIEYRSAAPGIDGAAFGVLLGCLGGLIALYVACGLLAARTRITGTAAPPPVFQRFAAGMTTALLSSLGVFLGVGFTAAVCYGWASFLNRGDGPTVEVPPLLARVAYAWGGTVLVVVGLALVILVRARRARPGLLDRARAAFTFGTVPGCRLPERWLPKVAAAMFRAGLRGLVDRVAWIFAILGLVLSLAAGVEYGFSGARADGCATWELVDPLDWLSEAQECGRSNPIIALGTLALLGLAGLLLLLGRGAVRRQSVRRGVNVVWDVIAFWPRAVHPFVPPPYSQHAVADLRERIRWHLRTTTGDVVVAAHSQGSLIALSALLWLTATERARIGFVTFGSQLQIQFSRAFPHYVDLEVLRWTRKAYGGRWVGLFRDTDAIGGPVLSWDQSPDRTGSVLTSHRLDAVDTGDAGGAWTDQVDPSTGRRICGPEWRLLDPTPSDPDLQTGAIPGLRGHSDYPADPDWPRAVAAVRPHA